MSTLPVFPVQPPRSFGPPVGSAALVQVSRLIRVNEARDRFQVTGTGRTVAVLDTGLRVSHVDIAGRVRTQRNFTDDNGGRVDDAADGHGHGTHVTGIIAANHDHTGIAPGAGVVALKVLTNAGGGDFRDVEQALEWVRDHHADHDIGVCCLSLSDGANYPDDTAFRGGRLAGLVGELRAAGVPVVVAAGNHYRLRGSRQGMGFPAIVRETVSVGAVFDADIGPREYSSFLGSPAARWTRADQVAPFSQRLHPDAHGACRTDVFAPGATVTSSGHLGDRDESGQDGTSQAAPVTAGLILLLQEYALRQSGSLPSVDALVRWLRQGAVEVEDRVGDHDNVTNTGLRFPRADALGALGAAEAELSGAGPAVATAASGATGASSPPPPPPFQIDRQVRVQRDAEGLVRRLHHPRRPYRGRPQPVIAAAGGPPAPAQTVADDYLKAVLPVYGFSPTLADGLDGAAPQAAIAAAGTSPPPVAGLVRAEQPKRASGKATFLYQQTYAGHPVVEAGLTVRVRERAGSPAEVTGSRSSLCHTIDLDPAPDARYLNLTEETLNTVLGLDNPSGPRARLQQGLPDGRRNPAPCVYRYRAGQRGNGVRAPGSSSRHPGLELPAVPAGVVEGRHYLVVEALFELELPDAGPLNWGALIDTHTGAVLQLLVFVSGVDGLVYPRDPITVTGDPALRPNAPDDRLDALRIRVTLEGLVPANPQELRGDHVHVREVGPPFVQPPRIDPTTESFSYRVRSDDFGATNAYYQCDRLFRLVTSLGFPRQQYFDGTAFPVRVDHRSSFDGFSNVANASAPGNVTRTGSDGFRFALAQANSGVSMAAAWRVVLHEFGHVVLWDHLHWPNFTFAHSLGDSLAAILNDPRSNAPDRGRTFPWTPIRRRHDRSVTNWAWGGPLDDPRQVGDPESSDRAGYIREQILSTTLFLLYQAVGGAHRDPLVRVHAAGYVVRLLLATVDSFHPLVRPQSAEDFATALRETDQEGDEVPASTVVDPQVQERLVGGTIEKVVRFAFAERGLYQAPGAPTPVRSAGQPPAVDVYVYDWRGGRYEPRGGFDTATRGIWNRHAADEGTAHQAPRPGQLNWLYVRVKNRGLRTATQVRVEAFLGGGAPDWAAGTWMSLGGEDAPDLPPREEAVVGPFKWLPTAERADALVVVRADGDEGNLDALVQPVPFAQLRRIAHCDNNLGLRTLVAPSVVFFDIGETLADAAVDPGTGQLQLEPRAAARAVLVELQARGIRMGLISTTTGFTAEQVDGALAAAELLEFFAPELRVYSTDVGLEKDSTEVFLLAAERTGLSPGAPACVFVGEDATERKLAARAGFRVADVPSAALNLVD